MKKWFALAVVAVLAVLAVATVVSAQTPQPQSTPQPGTPGYERGGMMGRGIMRGGLSADDDSPLHDAMVAALAQKLGLTASELQARLDKGETMWQIAESKGVTAEQFKAWMVDARNAAIDAAVKAGTITQQQGDWMKQRGQKMPGFENGMNPENCPMNGEGVAGQWQGKGMMGRGRWAQPSTTTP